MLLNKKIGPLTHVQCNSYKILSLKDVREEKEFQVSHLGKAHHVNPSLKDLEKVVKLIGESGTKWYNNNCIPSLP